MPIEKIIKEYCNENGYIFVDEYFPSYMPDVSCKAIIGNEDTVFLLSLCSYIEKSGVEHIGDEFEGVCFDVQDDGKTVMLFPNL